MRGRLGHRVRFGIGFRLGNGGVVRLGAVIGRFEQFFLFGLVGLSLIHI